MKIGIVVCGLIAALSASDGLAAEATKAEIRAAIKEVKNYGNGTDASDIRAKAQKGLAFYLAHENDVSNRADLVELGGAICSTAKRGGDFVCAKEMAERMVANAKAHPYHRLFAAHYLAAGLVEKGDFTTADSVYAKILETKGIEPARYVDAWAGRAKLYTLREDLDRALKTLDLGVSALPGAGAWREQALAAFDDARVEVWTDFYKYETAFEYLVEKGRFYAALRYFDRGLVADLSLASKLCHRILDDRSADWDTKVAAWDWIYTREPAYADAHFPLDAKCTSKQTNSIIGKLAYKLKRPQIYNLEGSTTPLSYFYNRTQTIRAWEDMRRLQKTRGDIPDFMCAQYAMLAYAGEGNRRQAIAAAQEGLANDKLKPEERYELELAVKVLAMRGTADQIAAEIARVEPALAKDLDAKLRLARMDRVGAAALVTDDEPLARGMAQYRAKVKPQLPKKEYVVRYSERPVSGAGDWVNLPFKPVKSAFDRQYGGGGAAFLVTDVATGDRGDAVKGGDGQSSVTLEMVADEWGLHILRTFSDKRAREFEGGFLDAGSFEEYIAPGDNQPYTCFLAYPKKDAKASAFLTAYDAPGHRRIDTKDPSKFKSDTFFTDSAVLVYTGISWDSFATLVPTKASVWEYESVFWGPVECAWNGTESIHGRSTWGRLVFDLPEAARVKILKAQLYKAVNAYKQEKKTRHAWEGIITHWQDDMVGDPKFLAERLQPVIDDLDAVLGRVTPTMADADVIELAENYLAKFRDFRFTIDRLRREYLTDQLSR